MHALHTVFVLKKISNIESMNRELFERSKSNVRHKNFNYCVIQVANNNLSLEYKK